MSLEKLSTLSFDPNPNNLATSLRRLMTPIFAITGLSLIILAIFINYIKTKQTQTSSVESTGQTVSTEAEGKGFSQKLVKIDIEGAVQRPGIYEIPNDSRIQDVLITAGGMVAKADRIYVSKNINLAQRVFDGQKIYIPEAGLDPTPNLPNSTNLSNLIDINKATESELDSLSGIGPVTAKKIISGRPYQNISELLSRHLVSQSVYDKIKDKLAAY